MNDALPPSTSPWILVADDNPINQEVILEQLSLLGHEADIADDGEHALQLWRQGPYRVLLTDLHMPRLDGYGLARAIRQWEAQTGRAPAMLVALSAGGPDDNEARCRDAGLGHFLRKPVDLQVLGELLRGSMAAARAPAPAANDAQPLLDPQVLARYVGHDARTQARLRNDYIERLPPMRHAITEALARGDLDRTRDLAHQLKSTSATIGALQLSAACLVLERAARSDDPQAAAQAADGVLRSLDATQAALLSQGMAQA
ncbi:MAG: response regulator [Rubrivivax sp.]|nr:response regulator [Rubrivivax sp.]